MRALSDFASSGRSASDTQSAAFWLIFWTCSKRIAAQFVERRAIENRGIVHQDVEPPPEVFDVSGQIADHLLAWKYR